MCKSEICHCRHHEIKIKNDFCDIFFEVFSIKEERELNEKIESGQWEEGV